LSGVEMKKFRRAFDVFRKTVILYDFEEIKTPIFEETALFERSLGGGTDVVSKQMYTFEDKSGRSLTLRPEGTAGLVRAAISGNLLRELPARFWYCGPMFRYEKPQKDRRRQFYQLGAEIFGEAGCAADAEVIEICNDFFNRLGIEYSLKINSIGCPECRGRYEDALKKYLADVLDELCGDCRERYIKNPLRVLDCKIDRGKDVIKKAPNFESFLCEKCGGDFEGVKNILKERGISFEIDSRLVRGLDYYTGCVFEFYTSAARDAIAAGGRYDGLVKFLGGADVAAAGVAIGLDRISSSIKIDESREGYLITGVGVSGGELERLARLIREAGFLCRVSSKQKLKKALAEASSGNFKYAVIVGEDELKNDSVSVKDLGSGEQKTFAKEEFIKKL